MIVDHYDSDTGTVQRLLDEVRWENEPVNDGDAVRFEYWKWMADRLARSVKSMPRCKQRQQVGLKLDEARRQRNKFRRKVLGD